MPPATSPMLADACTTVAATIRTPPVATRATSTRLAMARLIGPFYGRSARSPAPIGAPAVEPASCPPPRPRTRSVPPATRAPCRAVRTASRSDRRRLETWEQRQVGCDLRCDLSARPPWGEATRTGNPLVAGLRMLRSRDSQRLAPGGWRVCSAATNIGPQIGPQQALTPQHQTCKRPVNTGLLRDRGDWIRTSDRPAPSPSIRVRLQRFYGADRCHYSAAGLVRSSA
jgi:hypothetical protein